jgi:hypothetical protein
MVPTMHLRFVKRRVGANVVRILQQKWEAEDGLGTFWQDVELAEDVRATSKPSLPSPD